MDRHAMIIDSLKDWINSNINKNIKIEDVAKKAGYSRWHLQRVFNKVTNQSLANYIRNKKLELAAKDLLESNDSIMEISMKYGFDSQQSFTRIFSRRYRQPPATFRKSHSPANESSKKMMNHFL
ncbi:helix-turn-helix domain-containing protein [Erwinia sp.]|uniref:helix-turn-helix domain-containing protein n=1 Tax=Erwinia citreus TaxID=558 RepID=UPI003C73A44A